jgi:uncharacterized OB-fold protein
MAAPTKKLGDLIADDPLAALRTEDPWKDFRQVTQVEIRLELRYRHSLGKYSRFFLELENHRFFATRCAKCGAVWAPPRPLCPNDLTITEWKELPGTGTLEGFSVIHRGPASSTEPVPYVLAYVRLDGASTLFPHVLRDYPADRLAHGLRVKVAYADNPVEHPMQLMWFAPLEP